MGNSVSLSFNGDLAKQVALQAGKQAIDLCLLDLQKKSVQVTPISPPGSKTRGDLRDSIHPGSEFEEIGATISKTLGTNLPYALRIHEHPEYHFSEPGTGAKYIERPFDENVAEYENIIKQKVIEALNSHL